MSLAPKMRPRAEQLERRPAGSAPLQPDPRPSPYLPQHFPAVGTEQVVGGGRRAAAAPIHRGCGHRGRAAGRGRAVTAAARAAAEPDRPCVAGCASASSRRDVRIGGDGPRASDTVRGDHRGGCRSDGGDGGGCSSPARCSTRPHSPDPRPRQARTSSRHRCLRRRRRSASVRPRPRLSTTFTTFTVRDRPLPPIGQLRPRPRVACSPPMSN